LFRDFVVWPWGIENKGRGGEEGGIQRKSRERRESKEVEVVEDGGLMAGDRRRGIGKRWKGFDGGGGREKNPAI
jgi:hypothetical protein